MVVVGTVGLHGSGVHQTGGGAYGGVGYRLFGKPRPRYGRAASNRYIRFYSGRRFGSF